MTETKDPSTPEELAKLFEAGSPISGREAIAGERSYTPNWEILATTKGYVSEKSMLADLYQAKGLTLHEVAQTLSTSTTTVRIRMAACGLPTRGRGGARNLKGMNAVERALAEHHTTLIDVIHMHDNLYQAAKFLGLPPHRLYGYCKRKLTKKEIG